MAKFGKKSMEKLKTLDERLQKILLKAIKIIDFKILEGHRGKELQNSYYDSGNSKLKFPKSKHNKLPSEAVDIATWFPKKPHIRWDNLMQFTYLAGIIMGVGHSMGIKLRYGHDWNRNGILGDYSSFHDYPHIELDE